MTVCWVIITTLLQITALEFYYPSFNFIAFYWPVSWDILDLQTQRLQLITEAGEILIIFKVLFNFSFFFQSVSPHTVISFPFKLVAPLPFRLFLVSSAFRHCKISYNETSRFSTHSQSLAWDIFEGINLEIVWTVFALFRLEKSFNKQSWDGTRLIFMLSITTKCKSS